MPTELYSDEAREAEKRFGIEPRRVFSDDQGKQMSDEVFLGVAFTSGVEEVVIPFFDRGLPVEYELTRSIRVVSRSGRKKVGILTTDAKLMGGFDMRTFGQTPEWSIVTELKKQYDVSSVSPDAPIASDLDVLLVAQPSSLTQKQIDNLTDYVQEGRGDAALPRPVPGRQPADLARGAQACRRAARSAAASRPSPRATCEPLLDLVGIDWPTTEIVWNVYNPHPKLADLQSTPEIVFIGKGSGADGRVQRRAERQRGPAGDRHALPGLLRPKAGGSGPEFIPLLRTGPTGGTHPLERRRPARLHGHLRASTRAAATFRRA